MIRSYITQQTLIDAFILKLSGAAELYNDQEIKWHIGDTMEMPHESNCTIEFPTNSPAYAIVRTYHSNGRLHRWVEYRNGAVDGKYKAWHDNGQPECDVDYSDNKRHGVAQGWHVTGNLYYRNVFRDDVFVGGKTYD
jgi:hypothetical protein